MGARTIAVIGAGPAGLYAAQQLAANPDWTVVLFNRDIKPGGLAEYGIYYDKYTMKEGLRKQFRNILAHANVHYFGNVVIGQTGQLTLPQLLAAGFDAVLVTVGAQGTKWLGLPGEQLSRVYHAKDVVYHYNQLPPYAERAYPVGEHVAVIGAGNVMLDVTHWLVRNQQVKSVTAVVRRGAADVKFTRKEMEAVFANLDQPHLAGEIARTAPMLQAVGQDAAAAHQFLLSAAAKAVPSTSATQLRFRFLAAPNEILGDAAQGVQGLRVAETTLVQDATGRTVAQPTGTTDVLAVDTVIFAIGDTVDAQFGLPVQRGAFVKRANPAYPVEGLSYEADYGDGKVFLAGWAREASTGLVGVARKDAHQAVTAIGQYLATLPDDVQTVDYAALLAGLPDVVDKATWQRLERIEAARAAQAGLPIFKFDSNADMLAALQEG